MQSADLGNPQAIGFRSGRQVLKDDSGPGRGQSDRKNSDLSSIDSSPIDARMRRECRHNGEPVTRCLLDQACAGVVPRSSENFLEDDEGDDDRDILAGHMKQVKQRDASKVDQRRRVNDAH